VVYEGDTLTLPDAPVTPTRFFTPLSIAMEVAPLVTQLSVAVPPDVMLDGETYRAAIGREPVGGGVYEPPTDTVVLALLLPAEFVAVRLKVMLPVPVVFIVWLPDGFTWPKPAMLTDEALIVFQLNVVEPPGAILAGLAVNERMVGSGPETGGDAGLVTITSVVAEVEFEPLVATSV